MKKHGTAQLEIEHFKELEVHRSSININKEKFIQILETIFSLRDLISLKNKIIELRAIISYPKKDREGLLNIDSNGDTIVLRRDIIISELNQILEAQTLERAKYYIKRLKNATNKIKTSKLNDINLLRWKEYDEIITDSLWVLDKRDSSGAHLAWYWGNFIPQIPHQMMLRYTKKGEWILDPFVGSGTTLIECRRLGRNGIGIEINEKVVKKAKGLIDKETNRFNIVSDIIVADSTEVDFNRIIKKRGIEKVSLLIMHPPYHDIIKFSENPKDLSNATSVDKFLKKFSKIVENTYPILEKGKYLAVVIGDKYSKGEWIPLGFYVMNEVLRSGYKLKSIIVKNFEETRAKRNQKALWRYRALVGGFYIFKHEYILLFKKGLSR